MVIRIVLLVLLSGPLFSQVNYNVEEGAIRMVHFDAIEVSEGFVLCTEKSNTPILGTWMTDSIASFRPAVPLRNGHTYRLMLGEIEYLSFKTPEALSTPQVISILPNRDTVPSNLLKISVVFSEPMAEMGGVEALSLYDLTEKRKIQRPFLEMATELWSENGDTLTVWIDPGRIKRDLIPNKTLGPVLVPDHQYEIAVSSDLKNSHGVRLDAEFAEVFYSSGEDRDSPDPNGWTVLTPNKPESPIKVLFNDVLNPATVVHYIKVLDKNGDPIKGTMEVEADGSGFVFNNVKHWQTGEYIMIIDPKLEDLAGNQLHRLFDSDNTIGQADSVSKDVELRFKID